MLNCLLNSHLRSFDDWFKSNSQFIGRKLKPYQPSSCRLISCHSTVSRKIYSFTYSFLLLCTWVRYRLSACWYETVSTLYYYYYFIWLVDFRLCWLLQLAIARTFFLSHGDGGAIQKLYQHLWYMSFELLSISLLRYVKPQYLARCLLDMQRHLAFASTNLIIPRKSYLDCSF